MMFVAEAEDKTDEAKKYAVARHVDRFALREGALTHDWCDLNSEED